jgi:hypothetical protein
MPRNITIKTICLIYSCLVSITYASDAMATGGHAGRLARTANRGTHFLRYMMRPWMADESRQVIDDLTWISPLLTKKQQMMTQEL